MALIRPDGTTLPDVTIDRVILIVRCSCGEPQALAIVHSVPPTPTYCPRCRVGFYLNDAETVLILNKTPPIAQDEPRPIGPLPVLN